MDELTRLLERQCRALDGDDDERWSKTLSVQMAREERRRAAAEFRGKLVDLRDSLRAIYGAERTRHILELEGRTPRGFQQLALYGRWLVRRLRDVELPEPKVELKVDPRAWADSLEPSAKRLGMLVDRLRTGDWREQDAVHARNLSLGAFDADYVPITRLIESIYLLAGHLQLAKKLRPHRSRRLVNRNAASGPETEIRAHARPGTGQRLLGFLSRVLHWLGRVLPPSRQSPS